MANQNEIRKLEPPTSDDRLIWDIASSTFYFPTLTVADELGLFSFLEQTPATPQEVATKFSLGMRATEALLGVLTSLGLLIQHLGKFSITEVSRNYLLPESPYYWGDFLRGVRDNSPTHASVQSALLEDNLREHPSLWQTGGLDPKRAEQFTRRMHSRGLAAAVGMARRGNFTDVRRLLDVAGGSGCFSIALAMRHPDIHFTVLELPSVCPVTAQYVADYGLQDQIDTYAADMFKDAWPTGYDAIFFSDIFHDWDREMCLQLGRHSYEMLPSGGRIYLHEMLLDDTRDGPLVAIALSMRMLVATQGKQSTLGELDELLKECGFGEVSVTSTSSYFSLVSATKP
jgi:hypothetical protein